MIINLKNKIDYSNFDNLNHDKIIIPIKIIQIIKFENKMKITIIIHYHHHHSIQKSYVLVPRSFNNIRI